MSEKSNTVNELSDEELKTNCLHQLDEIDRMKRILRHEIHLASIHSQKNKTIIDQNWLTQKKSQIDQLIQERESHLEMLSILKQKKKEDNKMQQAPLSSFLGYCFMVEATTLLPSDLYMQIREKAVKRFLNLQ